MSTDVTTDPTAAFLAECCPLPGAAILRKWPGLARPLRKGDWIHATDGYLLARLAVDLAPLELVEAFGPPEGAIPERIAAEPEFLLNAFDRREAFDLPECGPWLIPCPECDGNGEDCCDDCAGRGKVLDLKAVVIAEAPGREPYRLAACNVDRLRRAGAILYPPSEWPTWESRRGPAANRFAAAFVCADACEGLVMPMVPPVEGEW